MTCRVCLDCGVGVPENRYWCLPHAFYGLRRVTVTATPKPPGEVRIQELSVKIDVEYAHDPVEEAASIICSKEGIRFEDYNWRVTL